jgi:hypothetical protein
MSIYLWLPSVWDAGRVSHLDIEEPYNSLHEDVARATMTTKVTDGYAQRPTPTFLHHGGVLSSSPPSHCCSCFACIICLPHPGYCEDLFVALGLTCDVTKAFCVRARIVMLKSTAQIGKVHVREKLVA